MLEIAKKLHRDSTPSLNTSNETTQGLSPKTSNTSLEVLIPRIRQSPSLLSSEGVLTQNTLPLLLTSEGGGGIHSSPSKDDRIKRSTTASKVN